MYCVSPHPTCSGTPKLLGSVIRHGASGESGVRTIKGLTKDLAQRTLGHIQTFPFLSADPCSRTRPPTPTPRWVLTNKFIRQSKSGDSFVFLVWDPKKLFCLSLNETHEEKSQGRDVIECILTFLLFLSIWEFYSPRRPELYFMAFHNTLLRTVTAFIWIWTPFFETSILHGHFYTSCP